MVPRPERPGAWWWIGPPRLAVGIACCVAVGGCVDEPARAPAAVAPSDEAIATAELDVVAPPPETGDGGGGHGLPKSAPALRDLWLEVLRSPSAHQAVERAVGRSLVVGALEAEARGPTGLALRVRGAGVESAVARCTAWIHAASGVFAEGAGEGLLARERARLLAELGELGASLAALPDDASEQRPSSAKEATMFAHVRTLEVDVLKRPEDVRASKDAPSMLRAIAKLWADAGGEVSEKLAEGYGPHHPDVRRAAARRDALAARFERQRKVERAAAEALDAGWQKDKDRPAVARYTSLQAWLARPELAGRVDAASSDPIALRVVALEDVAAEAEFARLAVDHGARHPVILVAEAQRQEIAASFRAELRATSIQLQIGLTVATRVPAAAPSRMLPGDDRAARVEARRAELAAVIAQIERRRDWLDGATRTMVVRASCAPGKALP